MQSDQINELAAALAAAQGEIKNAPKTSDNPFYHSKYADLSEIWDSIRAPLSKHGLALVQIPSSDGKTVTVKTILMHSSGQWIDGELMLVPTKQDPHGISGGITYARRISAGAFAGVAPTDDDDGNLASGKSLEDKAAKAKQTVAAALPAPPNEKKPPAPPEANGRRVEVAGELEMQILMQCLKADRLGMAELRGIRTNYGLAPEGDDAPTKFDEQATYLEELRAAADRVSKRGTDLPKHKKVVVQ